VPGINGKVPDRLDESCVKPNARALEYREPQEELGGFLGITGN
jgi:hypothetical protein